MANVSLAIEHLRVDFPEVVAVNDLSLTLESGDVCGLIGPNGAGKTTTMRAVAGLQEYTHGSVTVNGYASSREPDELKRRLGYMPDFSPVYDHLTVDEFLDHFGRAYHVPDRRRRIEDCLELTWLADKRNTLCEELSRGMKQRLGLAKTLLPDPQVLLLDEPASGLDPLGRIELWKLLWQLHDAGKSVLISSHVLTELSSFCNKAAIMDHGRLVAFGTIAELRQRTPRQCMSVKWRGADETPFRILQNAAPVQNLVPMRSGAKFDFAGDADGLHELLRLLIAGEVHVTEWRNLEDDLQQIFLESGVKALM